MRALFDSEQSDCIEQKLLVDCHYSILYPADIICLSVSEEIGTVMAVTVGNGINYTFMVYRMW